MSRDLFGPMAAQPKLTNPDGLVTLGFDCCSRRSTDKAWFLTKPGQGQGHHVARSRARRGVGPHINDWTMPRWLARENGWL